MWVIRQSSGEVSNTAMLSIAGASGIWGGVGHEVGMVYNILFRRFNYSLVHIRDPGLIVIRGLFGLIFELALLYWLRRLPRGRQDVGAAATGRGPTPGRRRRR